MTAKGMLFFLAIELALAGASCTSKCIDAAPPDPAAVAQDTAQYEPVVPSVQFEHSELEGFSVISHFVISGNDTVVSNDTIEACYEEIVEAGDPAELHEVSERALSPFRFSRISGISPDISRVAFDLLVDEGVIGSTGVRLLATCEAAERIKGLDLDPLFNAHRADMEDQLAAVWAVHQFNSEFAAQNVAFFLAHL